MFEFTIPAGSVAQLPRPLAASIVAHGLASLLLLTLQFSSNAPSVSVAEHYTLIAPVPEKHVTLRKVRPPRPDRYRPIPAAVLPAPAHLDLPAAPMIPAPAIDILKPTLPEIPRPAGAPAEVKASRFSEVKTGAPEPAPKPIIKASGFQSAEISTKGPARGVLAAAGGFDSASAAEGAPVRKAVASAGPGGFSDASAAAPSGGAHGAIASGSFGDTTVDRSARQTAPRKAAAAFTPVEILSKTKPAYTDEARREKIEGEVLLEMQFSASGEARVLRLVRGLGHGLDETALAAARSIRFRPATRDGGPVDSAAIVHIVFQLAN